MQDLPYLESGIFLITAVITILIATLFRRGYKKYILRSSELIKNDPTKYSFIGHLITAVIYCVGFGLAIYQVPLLRAYASSLLAGAGILAVAVGFASQHSLKNVISGLFIVMFKPYKIHDRITVNNEHTGIVEDITLRHTVIRDFENRRIVIPNSVISDQTIVNADMTDERYLKFVEFDISYESDIALAKSIIEKQAKMHPLQIDGRSPEQISRGVAEIPVRVVALKESSIGIRAWIWCANMGDAFVLSCDLYESVKLAFDDSGIEIPYPHQVHVEKKK